MEGSGFATTVSNPWHLFFTAKFDDGDTTKNQYLISSPNDRWGFQIDSGKWEIYDGSGSFPGNSADTNWHIFSILNDSNGKFTVNVDGSSAGITNVGSGTNADSLSAFELGDWKGGGLELDFNGEVGEILFYNTNKTSSSADIRSYLNRWI
jgi:hypothetical protein